ncbi:MAG: helix-turn-helix domain-containing protein [Bacteroidetes bacterium]|nr:MAG: helix-turn-helix domain-containing protein [Bacteroidota bacterium]
MPTPFASRLAAARKMAGLSLQQLADRLGGVLSKQALHKYEQGKAYPNSKVLIALSQALAVPIDFFFSEPEVQAELTHVEFRKRTRLNQTQQTAIIERCNDHLRRYLELEQVLAEEKRPRSFSFDRVIRSAEDVEEAANMLRRDWDLGHDPIPSVLLMLEDNGYKVVEIDADPLFDGLKGEAGQHRLIAVNKNFDICRIRFTALHELAYHLLVFPEDMPEKERENLCHTFAGAVLLPASRGTEAIRKNRTNFYLPELELLKSYWGISIAAIFARARHLGLISEYVYVRFNKIYRSNYFHKDEPGSCRSIERASRFEQLLYRGIAEDRLTVNQAAILSNMTVGELRHTLDHAE